MSILLHFETFLKGCLQDSTCDIFEICDVLPSTNWAARILGPCHSATISSPLPPAAETTSVAAVHGPEFLNNSRSQQHIMLSPLQVEPKDFTQGSWKFPLQRFKKAFSQRWSQVSLR